MNEAIGGQGFEIGSRDGIPEMGPEIAMIVAAGAARPAGGSEIMALVGAMAQQRSPAPAPVAAAETASAAPAIISGVLGLTVAGAGLAAALASPTQPKAVPAKAATPPAKPTPPPAPEKRV